MLEFLTEKHHREAAKAVADGDNAPLAASLNLATESSAAGVARTNVEDRVHA